MINKQVLEELQTLEKKVDRILYILESDPTTATKGLVEKTSINENRLNGIDEKIRMYESKAALLGFIGAAIFTGIIYLIEVFIK